LKPDPAARKAAEAKLKAAQDRARRKKLGPPLALTDQALDQASAVSDLDVTSAEALCRAYSADALALFDATTSDAKL
jgi:hypothetical protein